MDVGQNVRGRTGKTSDTDASEFFGRSSVDAVDSGMRNVAANYCPVQHVWQRLVSGVARFLGHLVDEIRSQRTFTDDLVLTAHDLCAPRK